MIGPEYQDQNPKDAVGSTKVPMGLVPATFIAETALAFLEGKEKYGQVNWRAAPVRASVYIDALKRHISKYEECQDRDPDTLVHHLGNLGACAGILIDAAAHGTLVDDRNYTKPDLVSRYIDNLAHKVRHIKELFKDKNPKHWTKRDMSPATTIDQEAEREETLVNNEIKKAARIASDFSSFQDGVSQKAAGS